MCIFPDMWLSEMSILFKLPIVLRLPAQNNQRIESFSGDFRQKVWNPWSFATLTAILSLRIDWACDVRNKEFFSCPDGVFSSVGMYIQEIQTILRWSFEYSSVYKADFSNFGNDFIFYCQSINWLIVSEFRELPFPLDLSFVQHILNAWKIEWFRRGFFRAEKRMLTVSENLIA